MPTTWPGLSTVQDVESWLNPYFHCSGEPERKRTLNRSVTAGHELPDRAEPSLLNLQVACHSTGAVLCSLLNLHLFPEYLAQAMHARIWVLA